MREYKTKLLPELQEQLNIIKCIYDDILDYNKYFIIAKSGKKWCIVTFDGSVIREDETTRFAVLTDEILYAQSQSNATNKINVKIIKGPDAKTFDFDMTLYRYASGCNAVAVSESTILLSGADTIIVNTENNRYERIPLHLECSSIKMLKVNTNGQMYSKWIRSDELTLNSTENFVVDASRDGNYGIDDIKIVFNKDGIKWYDIKELGSLTFVGTSVDYDVLEKTPRNLVSLFSSRSIDLRSDSEDHFNKGIKYSLCIGGKVYGTEHDGFNIDTRSGNIMNKEYILSYDYKPNSNRKLFGIVTVRGVEVVDTKYTNITLMGDDIAVLEDSENKEIIVYSLSQRKAVEKLHYKYCAIHPILNIVTVITNNTVDGTVQYICYEGSGRKYPLVSFLQNHKSYLCSQYPNIFMVECSNLYRLQVVPQKYTFIDNGLNVISNPDKIAELKKANWVGIQS